MALKIIINGIIADLKGASKQELVFTNPMWDYEKMTGDYGLPFSLPFSPTNDRIFSNARSEFSESIATSYTCEQYFNDDLIAEGLILLTDTNGAYNCNFTSNIRDIFTHVSGSVRYDGYLRDILPAGPDVSTLALRNAMTTWNNIVCYPYILNNEFYAANAPVGWDNYLNSYNGTTYQNTTFVPAVSVKYILTQIEDYYGITINGAFVTDAGFNELCVMTNASEDGSATANLKLAVGDISPAGFINELRNAFGLTGDVDLLNKIITLNYANTYFNAEVSADWSNYSSKINSRNTAPYTGIELDFAADSGDLNYKISTFYGKYTTPLSTKNRIIKTTLSPLGYNAGLFPSKISQNGVTTINGQHSRTVGIRLGFYRGIVSSRPQIAATQGSSLYNLRTDSGANKRRDKLFNHEEAFWKSTFEASFKINLRKLNLSTFDIKSKVHINGWNYLIKRIVMDTQNPENSLLEAYRA